MNNSGTSGDTKLFQSNSTSMHSISLPPGNLPSVTVAIPTWNETAYIEETIRCFLSTEYPYLAEIIIADGGSTDGTQEIIQELSKEDPRVKLLHNSFKVQSAGLNLILEHANAEVLLRADAHSEYAADYVERCIEALLESQALNVGGAQRFVAKTPFQSGVSLASKSFLGSGGAKYRDLGYSGYAETVYLGCFWKEALMALSGYCVEATQNEDFELNLRLKQYYENSVKNIDRYDRSELGDASNLASNKAIYISSKIRAWYYPRSSFRSLYKQYFKYGKSRYMTSINHPEQVHWRGNLPFLSLFSLSILSLIDLLVPQLRFPIIEILPFLCLIPVLEALRITWKFRDEFNLEIWRGDKQTKPSLLTRWFLCSVALLTIPIAHALGFAYQLISHRVFRKTSI